MLASTMDLVPPCGTRIALEQWLEMAGLGFILS